MRIEISNVKKTYQRKNLLTRALQDINLSVQSGEKIVIIGESGAGKSTLLNIIGLVDRDFEGVYQLDGKNVKELKKREQSRLLNSGFGFVFQEYALIEEETVFANVKIPLLYGHSKRHEYREKVESALEKVGLSGYIDRKVNELSGGQRQRIAIARALVNEPAVILADEPTGALDVETGEEIMNILYEYTKEDKILIVVTHDLELAKQEGIRLVRLKNGRLYQ